MEEIGVIGGTGPLGGGLALRWALAGNTVYIGSRTAARAREARDELAGLPGASECRDRLLAATNEEAVERCRVAVLAVPASVEAGFLEALRPMLEGKILIDCTVELDPADITRVRDGHSGAALRTRAILGDGVRVVAGFHTVAAARLRDIERPLTGDTFIAGDETEAKRAALNLAAQIGLRAFDVGPLENAATLERLTAMLIGLNKRYKRRAVGIQLTGI